MKQHIEFIERDSDWKEPNMTPAFYRKTLEHIEKTSGTNDEKQERTAYFRRIADPLLAIHTKKLAGKRASV